MRRSYRDYWWRPTWVGKYELHGDSLVVRNAGSRFKKAEVVFDLFQSEAHMATLDNRKGDVEIFMKVKPTGTNGVLVFALYSHRPSVFSGHSKVRPS